MLKSCNSSIIQLFVNFFLLLITKSAAAVWAFATARAFAKAQITGSAMLAT